MVSFDEGIEALYRTSGSANNVGNAVERMWRIQDSQGQILAVDFRQRYLNPFKVSLLCSAAVCVRPCRVHAALIRDVSLPVCLPDSAGEAGSVSEAGSVGEARGMSESGSVSERGGE